MNPRVKLSLYMKRSKSGAFANIRVDMTGVGRLPRLSLGSLGIMYGYIEQQPLISYILHNSSSYTIGVRDQAHSTLERENQPKDHTYLCIGLRSPKINGESVLWVGVTG